MAVILVACDLTNPRRKYQPLRDYLAGFTHCKDLESVWLLDTELTTREIRDALKPFLDVDDRTFVVRLQRDWYSTNLACGDWLKDPKRMW
jgi:hypothetical protein